MAEGDALEAAVRAAHAAKPWMSTYDVKPALVAAIDAYLAARPGLVSLSEEERRIVLTALGDVWRIPPLDEEQTGPSKLYYRLAEVSRDRSQ